MSTTQQIQFIQVNPEQLQNAITESVKQQVSELKKYFTEPEELLTREETATLLKVDKSTLWNWQKQGKLIPYGLQGRVYYKRSDIMKAIVKLK
ncbi:helix-turn-helix domain-containing protein [Wenyingzhuangia sp. 2_MG-2023]|uniref:helix-turn-helix domain-containing protein n=1 Tax=Wenyingzhuangia sp. 2_MG-2023 TaxID=3062639 RepID=UPI0026E3E2A4|nr:helix-turn-helix domain-containing protein [Wenyingzhuangia sp. 2_MG-2023]MDO6736501.1 helix-turn-helix domain-containing protein [Wenyingzhuangia sp. 2_MG-2023]